MTLTRYILVDPDGTERPEYEYQDPYTAAEVAQILGCFVRIRHYDKRSANTVPLKGIACLIGIAAAILWWYWLLF